MSPTEQFIREFIYYGSLPIVFLVVLALCIRNKR